MKTRHLVTAFLAMLILTVMVIGCGKKSETPAPSSTMTPPAATEQSKAATGSALGSEQTAGPFKITLTSEPATPKVGQVRFIAMVMKDGKMIKDAKVSLELGMTGMSGSRVDLKPAGAQYEGTAKVSMAGDWTAKVTAKSGSENGTAEYKFTAVK